MESKVEKSGNFYIFQKFLEKIFSVVVKKLIEGAK